MDYLKDFKDKFETYNEDKRKEHKYLLYTAGAEIQKFIPETRLDFITYILGDYHYFRSKEDFKKFLEAAKEFIELDEPKDPAE